MEGKNKKNERLIDEIAQTIVAINLACEKGELGIKMVNCFDMFIEIFHPFETIRGKEKKVK